MTVTTALVPFFRLLAPAGAVVAACGAQGAEAPEGGTVLDPRAFNLSLYAWLPGVDGTFSAGPFNNPVDASFIDITEKLRSFPLAFMGRFERHYKRLGPYVDGNYRDLDFEPRIDGGQQGFVEPVGYHGVRRSDRLFRPAASERINRWEEKAHSNTLELYAGGRTIWLDNQIEFRGAGSVSASKSLTSPLIGGRFRVEFSPERFVLGDGSDGGFGVDNTEFAGSILRMVGYRNTLLGVPASVEAGYKAPASERKPARTGWRANPSSRGSPR